MSRTKALIGSWLPAILWMALIFFLSSIPKLQVSEGPVDLVLRKLAHMVEYGILFVFLYRGFRRSTRWSMERNLFYTFVLTVFYAASDEYHQTFVPGRAGKLFDVGFDALGAMAGLVFVEKIVDSLPGKIKKILI